MLTKTLKRQPDSTVVRFYLAEDFREEKDGKISAICLYTDLNILFQMPADHPDPTPERPAALRSLCFLFNVSHAPRGASVSIDLRTPETTYNIVPAQPLPDNDLASNFIVRSDPCIVSSLGRRTFTVSVNERKFKFDWTFGRQTIQTPVIEANLPMGNAPSKVRVRDKAPSKVRVKDKVPRKVPTKKKAS